MRAFFRQSDFLEVETPIRVPVIAPELFITPVRSEGWFLITSPELHMKRMLAAGYGKIFQLCHCFRNGERGHLHNPEFIMLEWYRTGGNYLDVVTDTENLITALATNLGMGNRVCYQGKVIDITPPWPRVSVRDAFLKHAGWDPVAEPDSLRFDLDLCEKVIPHFAIDRPTVFMDYPAPMASLARLKPDDSSLAERAEIFIAGLEIANGYSELIDRRQQEKRFRGEIVEIEKQYGRKIPLPDKFLETMNSLPECAGIALGVDRLVMLFCDVVTIDEVMPFTVDTL